MLCKRVWLFAGAVVFAVSLPLGAMAQSQVASGTTAAISGQDKTSDKPAVSEILDRLVQALGGKEKLKSINSMVSKGSLSIPVAGITGSVAIRQTVDGKFQMTAEIPGVMDSQSASDGKAVWEVSSVTGAELLDGARAEQSRFQMALFPYLEMSKYFDTMECTGKETFAGEECYVVVYKNKSASPMTTYYSVKTGLEKGNRLNTVTAMGDIKIVTEVKAYAEKDGLKYASEVEATLPNGMKQVITIEQVELNTKIDPSDFVPPKEIADLMKK